MRCVKSRPGFTLAQPHSSFAASLGRFCFSRCPYSEKVFGLWSLVSDFFDFKPFPLSWTQDPSQRQKTKYKEPRSKTKDLRPKTKDQLPSDNRNPDVPVLVQSYQ